MSDLGAVSTGVARLADTGIVSDTIQTCSVLTRTERTLVNIVLTGFPFQACLTLTLVVVDEIVAVGLCSLARIALTIIDVDLRNWSLSTFVQKDNNQTSQNFPSKPRAQLHLKSSSRSTQVPLL